MPPPLIFHPVNGQPVHFLEAIRAAEARHVVLPDIYYGQLQGVARQLAFSIAGVASHDQLKAVMDSLSAWQANGKTFAQWQREIVVKNLGLPKYRLENIFRTNLQSNYQAGHWEQIMRNTRWRPYIMYDAINDSRTRPAHRAMDGIIRPFDDPFWKTHSPPNGYQCRCGVIALTETEAKARSRAGDNEKPATGLDKAVDDSNMQPDKGWDTSPRDRLYGIDQALQNRIKIDGLLPTTLNEMLKAWPGTNIAKRIPVTDLHGLSALMAEYARIYPEHLPHGVKGILPAKETDDFFMATDGKGLFWFAEIEHRGFNSKRDLMDALSHIKTGAALTEHHEYALETLWHEIWHNRQIGAGEVMTLGSADFRRLLMETVNQYVSRKSYSGFVERLGGKAVHQEWVMANGYGYREYVLRLRSVFIALGIEESIAGDLFNINANGNLMTLAQDLSTAIAKKTKRDKNQMTRLLFSVVGDYAMFTKLLRELNPS